MLQRTHNRNLYHEGMRMTSAQRLAGIELLDDNNQAIVLGSFWQEQPIVLLFIRHFGCLFCREQVAEWQSALSELKARGAELVVVGSGQPFHAKAFREEHNISFPLLVDPGLRAFAAAGLKRGFSSTLHPRVLLHGFRAFKNGFRQGAVKGDPWQQGGVFVIAPGDRMLYQHISREAGDHSSPSRALEALPFHSPPPNTTEEASP